MNFLAFFRKPHTEVRYIAATKVENLIARQKRADVRMELEIMSQLLTPSQKHAAIEAGKGRR
jgi:hypothetical protein